MGADFASRARTEIELSSSASQDSLVLKAFLTVHPGNIYALCAPRTPEEADDIRPEQVSRLLEQLAEQFTTVPLLSSSRPSQ